MSLALAEPEESRRTHGVFLVTNPTTGQPYPHGTAFTYERGCRCEPCHNAREIEQRWLPIAPVLEALEHRGWTLHEAEENIKVNLRKSDRLTTSQADRITMRLGIHPWEVWGMETWGRTLVETYENAEQLALPMFGMLGLVVPIRHRPHREPRTRCCRPRVIPGQGVLDLAA